MYTPSIDYLETAQNILARLEMEYKYASARGVDKPEMIKFLAEQLERLHDHEVLCWQEALNKIAEEGRQHPPTVPEIIKVIKDIAKLTRPALPVPEKEENIDWMRKWEMADDKSKFKFYITNRFIDVAPFIENLFHEYNIEHRGWKRWESKYMMSFHYCPKYITPSEDNPQEAYKQMRELTKERQDKIIKYFQTR